MNRLRSTGAPAVSQFQLIGGIRHEAGDCIVSAEPGGATQVLPVLTYEIAFVAQRLGEAIAVALYLLPALACVIVVLARYMQRGRTR